jgi:hypothetical protein
MNTPGRPTFAETITALTLTHPDYGVLHTPEEADIAEVLRDVETQHQGADQRDPGSDTWGTCTTCRVPWPCLVWNDADALGLLYLGRAHDRVVAHARRTLDRLAETDRLQRTR